MIIFDLDGTLANVDHRRYLVDASQDLNYLKDCCKPEKYCNVHTGRPFKPNWDKFHAECVNDILNVPISNVFHAMVYAYDHNHVQIWSGRSDIVEKETREWLERKLVYFSIFDIVLRMRAHGDNTPDDILKETWLRELQADGVNVMMAFDDRQKVVDMWRRNGIVCAQVSPGDF